MDQEIEVMRVVRVPPMGKLTVQVGSTRYERLSEVGAQEVKQLLLAAIGELIVFADGYHTLVDAGVAPPTGDENVSGEPVARSMEQRQAAFLASLEKERDAMRPVVVDPGETVAMAAAGKDKASTTLSIVDQIDAILQKYLIAEPKMAGRSIHLEQAPEGGLRINVDGEYFQRPAEIKEREIQLLIKMALKEWEAAN